MNWDHIKAVMGEGTLHRSKSGDQDLITNGSIAVAVPPEFMSGKGKDFPSMARLWEQNVPMPVGALIVGSCMGEGKSISRKVGDVNIAERFVRCMGDGVTWSVGTADKGVPPLLVHRDGMLVALVMPMNRPENLPVIPEPTDDQVFSPFASESNGRYLQTDKDLREEFCKAESERDDAQYRADAAEEEVEEWDEEIASLREALEARRSIAT